MINVNQKFRFKKNQVLGSPDAESDSKFESAFLDVGDLESLVDTADAKCIIIGRTGSGKSALIKQLVKQEKNVMQIHPEEMSLRFLSNSTILEYFRSIGIKLNFFYKILWKHVFIVELLKLYIGENTEKKENFLKQLLDKLVNSGRAGQAKKAAQDYFDNWSSEFWLHSESRIKELESELGESFTSEIGIDSNVLKSKASLGATLKEKAVEEIKYKAEKVISDTHAEDLIALMKILQEDVFNNKNQKKFFIVIDDLDKDWASSQIVYDLIGAMVEVIKEFQTKFQGVKIIIALRENLHHLVFTGKEHRGGQREKFEPLYLRLEWNKHNLIELVNSRLSVISDNKVNLQSVLDKKRSEYDKTVAYIIERTFLRPRDVISFFNRIIQAATDKTSISKSIIYDAERYYSMERLNAIEDEWSENYGRFLPIIDFLKYKHDGFSFENIKPEPFFDCIMDESVLTGFKGDLFSACKLWKDKSFNQGVEYSTFLKSILSILYRIGIIGVKLNPSQQKEFFYDNLSSISEDSFHKGVKIYIHKAFYSILKINAKEQDETFLLD